MIVNNQEELVEEKKTDNNQKSDVSNNNKTQDPDPPKKKLDKSKAKQWFIDYNKSKGSSVSDEEATQFAEDNRIKFMIGRAYRFAEGRDPGEEEVNKLYSSWEVDIDPVDEVLKDSTLLNTEKKNLNLKNKVKSTELDSTLVNGESSVDFKGYFNEDVSYQENIESIPLEVLRLSSEDATLTINNTLSQYGVKASIGSEDVDTDGITITRPDGRTKSFSMFTDDGGFSYKAKLRLVNPNADPDELEKQRYSEMISFIQGSEIENLSYQKNILKSTSSQDLPETIFNLYNSEMTPSMNDITFVVGLLGGDRKVNDYFDRGTFKEELWKLDIQRADASLGEDKMEQYKQDLFEEGTKVAQDNTMVRKQKIPNFPNLDPSSQIETKAKLRNRKEGLKKLKTISESFNTRRKIASSKLGNSLRTSGAYKKIDLNNPVSLNEFSQAGLMLGDIPLEQIKINGQPSTVNEISTMMYDYQMIQRIREGKVNIEIGDPKTAGLLADQVSQVKDLMRTQEAYDNKGILGFDNSITDWFSETSEIIEGTVTEFGLSAWELASNMSYIGYDSLVGLGVPESTAQEIMYGNIGLGGISNMRSVLDPKLVKHVRKEYQPEYEGDIFDSQSIGETVTKMSKPVANSLVYTGLFIVNPGVGLSATAAGTYGGDRLYQAEKIKELKEKQELGYTLTPQEQKALNQSGFESRMTSLLKTGIETGVTSLFTFKYFQGLKGVTKFSGPKTAENAKKIADAYAKNTRQTVAGKLASYLNVDKKAILAELPEENIIALSNYYVDVHFGLDTWDFERAKRMVGETSLVSIFSGGAMGVMSKGFTNKKIRKIAEQQVKNNINLPSENEAIVNKLNIDAQVNKMKKDAEQKLISLEGNSKYKNLLNRQIEADNVVGNFDQLKSDIVKRMTVNDKSQFLNIIKRIEEQDANISSPNTENNDKKKSEKNIVELKAEGKEILSKYPSDLSFYFADQSIQQEYLGKAIEVMGKEKTDAGETNFTLNSDDPAVFDRAAKLHTEAVADGIVKKRQDFNAMSNIGTNKASDYLKEVTRQELKDWNLSNDIVNVKAMLSAPELDLTVTKPVEEVKGDQDSEFKVTEEDGVVVTTSKIEKTQKQLNQERTGSIVNRIEAFNLDSDFANDLSPKQSSEIKKFFDDVKNGKKVSFGKVDAILDAHDIALQISSNAAGKKIVVGSNLKGVLKEDGSLTEKGLKLYNNLSQVLTNAAKFNTMTIEGLSLIRDTEIGAPLHNLIQEGLKSSSEAKQKIGKIKDQHTSLYESEVKAYNKQNGTKHKSNPRSSRDASYEMSILGMLKRRSGELNSEGQDVEFARAKNLITEELQKRKEDAESNFDTGQIALGEKQAAIEKYRLYKEVVERLGVVDAKSFEDVSGKALPFNLNAINRLAEVMPGQRAADRINDFEDHEADMFEEGSYTPMFMSKAADGSRFGDYFGPDNPDGISVNSGMNITKPKKLGEDLRLDAGLYWDQAYGQLNGMEMEILGKKHYETLDNLLQNPTFTNSFEDGTLKNILLNNFSKRSKMWKDDVRSSNISAKDIGDAEAEETLKKFLNAAYGGVSAISLTRLTQPISQFSSAWAGTYPILKNSEAKSYLKRRGLTYFSGTAGSFNMNNKVGRFLGYIDRKGKLGNIYDKSRTGFRNAIASQLAIDQNQSMPAEYYIKQLNLGKKEGKALKGLGVQLTIDRVLEVIGKSNEMTLNFMLANSDKAAASMAFEAHYLDYKVSKGEKVTDMDSFWEKENANPDIEAIKYADQIIDRTMRQSDPSGEALIYNNQYGKNAMRMIMPFQKFLLNARADFSNQISILQDPNISELQKQEARRFMKGKLNEIISFNAVKYAGSVATLKGVSGLLGQAIPFFSVDEDDIRKTGGMEGLIQDILPISGLDKPTLESRNRALAGVAKGFSELKSLTDDFAQYSMTYDNKFSTGKTYPVTGSTIQDAIQTLQPAPLPGLLNDLVAAGVNRIYGEDIAREFSSRELDEPMSADDYTSFAVKRLGMISIGMEYIDRYTSAERLREKGSVVVNRGDYKNQERYLTAPDDEMRMAVAKAADLLYQLRIHSVFNPIAPRADLDKFADRLERTMEEYFLQDDPDPRMQRFLGIEGPLEED